MKHGGDLTEAIKRYGGTPDTWLDLSTGINPHPWPIPATLPNSVWQRLPSRAGENALIDAARCAYNVPDDIAIALAPGTQALIQWLPRLAAPGAVGISMPTYSEHARAWSATDHDIVDLRTIDALPGKVRHTVIVNPNNPDGRIIDLATLARVGATLRDRGGWLVIDEAFADLDPGLSAVALCRDLPVIILRSFGKFYGLAGLRLGFATGSPDIIACVASAIGPWPCSGPALAIGTAALRDKPWARKARESLQHQAAKLDAVLTTAGFSIIGGTTLFRLARHPDARSYHAQLARHHIWCRSFEWADDLLRFGFPADDADFDRLADALKSHE